MKLTEAQVEKNKKFAETNGKKLDEHGRIIMRENVQFRINATIEAKE